jgi:hypothetical protein
MLTKNPLTVDLGAASRIAGADRPSKYAPPDAWTPEHVDVRLTEAFEILMTVPTRMGPATMKTVMPAFAYDDSDLEAQRELAVDISKAHKRLTRAKGSASRAEIGRMEEAIGWALTYLRNESTLAKAVGWSSFRKAVKREDGKLHHALGVSRRTFFRYRLRGLQIIASGLNASNTPVT